MKITLEKILADKTREVEEYKAKEPLAILKKKIPGLPPTRDFRSVFYTDKNLIGVIAEIKSKSPSEGSITGEDPLKIAREYEKSKAVAISVLTDKPYFGGDLSLIEKIKKLTGKPVLRKDFILDEYQIYQSRVYGADAILLIACILSKEKLNRFIKIAGELNLDCLVELHFKDDFSRIPAETEIYGINNRALKNGFKIDLNVTFNLLKYIPKGKIIISESGISTPDEVKRLRDAGVNGILTGTGVLKTLKKKRGYSPRAAIDFLLSGLTD